MRLIGTLNNQEDALRLASHLKQKGIETTSEPAFDAKDGHMSYQLWVHDEDRIADAMAIFEAFQKNPSRSEFKAPIVETPTVQAEPPVQRGSSTPFTLFVISLCSLVFLFSMMEMMPLHQEKLPEGVFLVNQIPSTLLFDFPPPFVQIKEAVRSHLQSGKEIPPNVKAELATIDQLPFWRGIYTWTLLKIKGHDPTVAQGPLFYQIGRGEVWRLFTPCLLHGSFLHILFNMIWVWILGRPIELRIGLFRTTLLTLATGIIPNVAQYLMSGPFFLGYSGVVLGLAGFIWMREKVAPWEGYPLSRSTMLFLLFFIGAMFALQSASFLIQIFTNVPFEPNIANTAHIVGALVGAGLGRLSYFSWRVK